MRTTIRYLTLEAWIYCRRKLTEIEHVTILFPCNLCFVKGIWYFERLLDGSMGHFFAKLFSWFSSQEYKVIIVGLDNAGKTTILYQFLMNEVVHTSPTIGSNVEEVVWKNIHFLMWDIGGQESLRAAWNTYYTNTGFLILVVDSTDRERLAVTKAELYNMLSHEDLKQAGVLIFANKQDIKGSMSVAEISEQLNLTSIKDHGWHIQACCALTGEGLYQGLEWITTNVRK